MQYAGANPRRRRLALIHKLLRMLNFATMGAGAATELRESIRDRHCRLQISDLDVPALTPKQELPEPLPG